MARFPALFALFSLLSLTVSASCVREAHPWLLIDANIHSGYNTVVSASSLGGGALCTPCVTTNCRGRYALLPLNVRSAYRGRPADQVHSVPSTW